MLLMSITAFADTRITSVSIKSGPNDSEDVRDGVCVAPDFWSDSDKYTVSYYDTSTDEGTNPKRERTYEIRLDANDGYYFPRETDVNVTVSNVSRISKKDTADDTTFIIRVRAWPYYQWPAVTGLKDVDANSERIRWDKGSADKWEYVLEWVDSYGNEKSKHGTTTKNYLDIKSYNKKYTGSNKDEREDSRVTGFAVRAVGNAGDNARTADGVWTEAGTVDHSEYDDSFDSWTDAVGSRGTSTSQTSGSTGSHTGGVVIPQGSIPSYVVRGTWNDHGNGQWSFVGENGHLYRNEWAAVDNSRYANEGQDLFSWFFFDENGLMKTGWYLEPQTGFWYYLQEESNGTRGAMFTGAHLINGKVYYFNENSDGTRGRCLNP